MRVSSDTGKKANMVLGGMNRSHEESLFHSTLRWSGCIKAALERYYFLCSKSFTFIPLQQQCDGQPDCPWGEDEGNCVQHVPDGPPVGVRTAQDRAALQVLDRETGAWFWACHDNFDRTLAKAACKQMGYSSTPTFSAVSIADTRGLPH
nr:transmembrane protease serine 4-like [Pelodiscus sinensis]|eukprot:XP_006126044.1 transmembrane protease serine 4-like [Pelodiscus sinensis]